MYSTWPLIWALGLKRREEGRGCLGAVLRQLDAAAPRCPVLVPELLSWVLRPTAQRGAGREWALAWSCCEGHRGGCCMGPGMGAVNQSGCCHTLSAVRTLWSMVGQVGFLVSVVQQIFGYLLCSRCCSVQWETRHLWPLTHHRV